MKKTINSLVIIAFICLLVGCQTSKKEASQKIKKITLNLQEGDPPTFNPYVGVDLRSRCLFLALFEPLMRRDCNGQLLPAAAERVEINDEHTIYTFHIRNHQWSNGEPVTSYHFEKAWKYALSPKSHCVRSDLFYPIKNAERAKRGEVDLDDIKITCPNSKTLVVELEHPTPFFLELTATSFFSPLFNATATEPSVFNGPFIVSEKVPDEKLVFKKNPTYWDCSSVQLDEIWFTEVKDPQTALSMYEKGELDLVGDPFSSLPFDAIPTIEKTGQLQNRLISRIFYLLINTDKHPFNSSNLRKALSLSLDRKQITEHLFFGEFPTLSLIPKTLSLIDNKILEEMEENPSELFEKAMQELNLTRETFPKIVFSYADLSGQKKLAEFIQEQWKEKLGIEIELMCSEWNIHITKLRKRDYQMGTLHLTTLYQDPMFYFDIFRNKSSLSNYCGWEDGKFKDILECLDKEVCIHKRKKSLKEAELKLFEEMPAIPIFTQNLQYLVQDNVNLVVSDLGIYDFKSTTVKTKENCTLK